MRSFAHSALLLTCLAMAGGCASAQTQQPPRATPLHEPEQARTPGHKLDQVLVKFRAGTTPAQIDAAFVRVRVSEWRSLGSTLSYVARCPQGSTPADLIAALKTLPQVEYAEFDQLLQTDRAQPPAGPR
jgi:hypothetical protein